MYVFDVLLMFDFLVFFSVVFGNLWDFFDRGLMIGFCWVLMFVFVFFVGFWGLFKVCESLVCEIFNYERFVVISWIRVMVIIVFWFLLYFVNCCVSFLGGGLCFFVILYFELFCFIFLIFKKLLIILILLFYFMFKFFKVC